VPSRFRDSTAHVGSDPREECAHNGGEIVNLRNNGHSFEPFDLSKGYEKLDVEVVERLVILDGAADYQLVFAPSQKGLRIVPDPGNSSKLNSTLPTDPPGDGSFTGRGRRLAESASRSKLRDDDRTRAHFKLGLITPVFSPPPSQMLKRQSLIENNCFGAMDK
jgi:hypothetical protein